MQITNVNAPAKCISKKIHTLCSFQSIFPYIIFCNAPIWPPPPLLSGDKQFSSIVIPEQERENAGEEELQENRRKEDRYETDQQQLEDEQDGGGGGDRWHSRQVFSMCFGKKMELCGLTRIKSTNCDLEQGLQHLCSMSGPILYTVQHFTQEDFQNSQTI